jgi:hypothetical protein
MQAMAGSSVSRAATALLLIGALALLLGIPLCADGVCPMDEASARAACHGTMDDCCQHAGDRAPSSPVRVPAPDISLAAQATRAAVPTPWTDRTPSPFEPVAAPAVLQGVGLFTLFATFLI